MIISSKDFDLSATFECGQCFRWERQANGSYIGVVGGYAAHVRQIGDEIHINSNASDEFWAEYFDLSRDYGGIKKYLTEEKNLKKAIDNCGNIRILKQPHFECLISYIISQNNNIPRIKKIIGSLCENFGEEILFEGGRYYSFPEVNKILGRNLDVIKSGFRQKYILDAAQKVATKQVDLDALASKSSDVAREELKSIYGVGDKVADCVLLFGYQKFDVFPKDVWIKRIMSALYSLCEKDIDAFAREKFSRYGGLAQQYLFFDAKMTENVKINQ